MISNTAARVLAIFVAFMNGCAGDSIGKNTCHGENCKVEERMVANTMLQVTYHQKEQQAVNTCGGNGNGSPCIFPFIFKGITHNACTDVSHSRPWCATSHWNGSQNAKQWGNCDCQAPCSQEDSCAGCTKDGNGNDVDGGSDCVFTDYPWNECRLNDNSNHCEYADTDECWSCFSEHCDYSCDCLETNTFECLETCVGLHGEDDIMGWINAGCPFDEDPCSQGDSCAGCTKDGNGNDVDGGSDCVFGGNECRLNDDSNHCEYQANSTHVSSLEVSDTTIEFNLDEAMKKIKSNQRMDPKAKAKRMKQLMAITAKKLPKV